MKNRIEKRYKYVCLIAMLMLLLSSQFVLAQGEEGFIQPVSGNVEQSQNALPPGATREGNVILHVISANENLHLLASFYYNNPRQWTRIYQDNQANLGHSTRLPVGQTLRIRVEDTWQPIFSYQEWFRLATRNGEWKPGHWKKASSTPVRKTSPPAQTTRSLEPKETASPVSQPEPEAPVTSSEVAVEEPVPAEEPVVEERSAVEESEAETPPVEEEPAAVEDVPATEETPEEEAEEEPAF